MGGYEVTTYSLFDERTAKKLVPHFNFQNFLSLSPNSDFGLLAAWGNFRDDSDLDLAIVDCRSGDVRELVAIHSIPQDVTWLDGSTCRLTTRVRPSVSGLRAESEFDLALPTKILVSKTDGVYKIEFLAFAS